MSEADKAIALEKILSTQKANNAVVATMTLSILLSSAGIALAFPGSLILPLVAMRLNYDIDDFMSNFPFLGSEETDGMRFNFRWKIDPSGYVYDAVSLDRLEGVKSTAFWIAADAQEEFWDSKPNASESGVVWDSLEWEQNNPLLTDQDGRYAWDVPEGWWRVKFEKEGYQTTWSEWLPVPPPQTEVNIGLSPDTRAK